MVCQEKKEKRPNYITVNAHFLTLLFQQIRWKNNSFHYVFEDTRQFVDEDYTESETAESFFAL